MLISKCNVPYWHDHSATEAKEMELACVCVCIVWVKGNVLYVCRMCVYVCGHVCVCIHVCVRANILTQICNVCVCVWLAAETKRSQTPYEVSPQITVRTPSPAARLCCLESPLKCTNNSGWRGHSLECHCWSFCYFMDGGGCLRDRQHTHNYSHRDTGEHWQRHTPTSAIHTHTHTSCYEKKHFG